MSATATDNHKLFQATKKTIVVTGASRRLGLFLCEQLLQQGHTVVALTRETSEALGGLKGKGTIAIYEAGAYRAANIDAIIQRVRADFQRLDALIHNSSVFEKDPADLSYDYDAYVSMFDLHMALPAQLNFGLFSLLNDSNNPGNIIHITDIYAENPNRQYVLYCSTKAALENLAKGFAKKFAPGVRVNTIQPGPIKFLPDHSDETKKQVLAETPLAQEGGFMPIFQAVMSILENTYMTGASIKVDGGRALGR